LSFDNWFDDPAAKGADAIDTRPGFAAMLERIAGNGVRTIIVETANRFARDLMVQEIGYKRLQEAGIVLIAADSPDQFVEDNPTAVLIRQILGAVAQFDKAMTVAKLRGARDRKRAKNGKCEGRKSMLESRPEVVKRAKELAREKRRSLREVADALYAEGHISSRGKPFTADTVQRMLAVSWSAIDRTA
jgi:DNA invertase Pin-like site-specific DNA recombinase